MDTQEQTTESENKPLKVYIGSAEVKNVQTKDNLVTYDLDNGLRLTVTKEQFNSICSETPYDDGMISMRKWKPLIESILALMRDSNVQLNDKNWIMDRIEESILHNHKHAIALMYGVPTVDWISLRAIDEKLKSLTIKKEAE